MFLSLVRLFHYFGNQGGGTVVFIGPKGRRRTTTAGSSLPVCLSIRPISRLLIPPRIPPPSLNPSTKTHAAARKQEHLAQTVIFHVKAAYISIATACSAIYFPIRPVFPSTAFEPMSRTVERAILLPPFSSPVIFCAPSPIGDGRFQ